jgi:hypothetical protein
MSLKTYLVTVIWYSMSTVTNVNHTDKFKYLLCILLLIIGALADLA